MDTIKSNRISLEGGSIIIMVKWLNLPYPNNLSDVGQSRDLSMFSCGGFRVRKEEELEINEGCSGAVWTVPVNRNFRKRRWRKEREEKRRKNQQRPMCLLLKTFNFINQLILLLWIQ